jgi:hypothetical protein
MGALPGLPGCSARGRQVATWTTPDATGHTNMRPPRASILMALIASTLAASCATPPSPTQPTRPTGIPYVDAVIEAGLSGDPQALKALFVLRSVPCTTEKWLLRQPLCPQGERDGTPVQTMPMLSADLGHLTLDEINSWRGIGEVQLYAVYRTGSYTYSDEFFPAGEFAVAFVPEGSAFAFILQVTRDGIVRIDYCGVHLDICPGSTMGEILQGHESDFILGPFPIVVPAIE